MMDEFLSGKTSTDQRHKKMKIIICDDSVEQGNLCKQRIAKVARENNIPVDISMVSSTAELMFKMEDDYPHIDLIYLDVNLQKMNGLAAASSARALGYHADIVFYTSSEDLTCIFGAFDVLALHYLLKNDASQSKFEEVFLRAYARAKKRDREVILLTCAGETRCIPLEDIDYFEVNKRIVTVYYDHDAFEFYSTLSKIEEHLFGRGFIRIHQSILVAKKAIQRSTKREVILYDGTVLPVGRTYNLKDIYEDSANAHAI